MKLQDVAGLLGARFESGEDKSEMDVNSVCASDLMSDVLAFSTPGALLLTGLTNAQSVMTASVADVSAVVYVRGKRPEPGVIELAAQKGIPVLTCDLSMFDACGRMHEAGFVSAVELGEPK